MNQPINGTDLSEDARQEMERLANKCAQDELELSTLLARWMETHTCAGHPYSRIAVVYRLEEDGSFLMSARLLPEPIFEVLRRLDCSDEQIAEIMHSDNRGERMREIGQRALDVAAAGVPS